MDFLFSLDVAILHFFNITLGHQYLDLFWLTITQLHKVSWFAYVIFPILMIWFGFRFRTLSLKVICSVIAAVALSDTIAYRVIKKNFHRDRPFAQASVSNVIRKIGQAHGPSFPSNHAANVFAGAYILGWYFRRRRHLFYGFATLTAISRVALGVHYPSDVLAGACLGIFVGYLVVSLIISNIRWLQPASSVSQSHKESWSWRSRNRRLERD